MPLFFMVRRLIITATVIFRVEDTILKSFIMIHHTVIALALVTSLRVYNNT